MKAKWNSPLLIHRQEMDEKEEKKHNIQNGKNIYVQCDADITNLFFKMYLYKYMCNFYN